MNLIFNPTAFKHGVSEKDIEYAMAAPLVDRLMDNYTNKYTIIGFDLNGNLLEVIMYQYLPRSK